MPELPEVETIARSLQPELVGREITTAEVLWSRTLAMPGPRRFRAQIVGQVIRSVGRRAKYLHLQLSAHHLFIHLRMSGDVWIREGGERGDKHDRLVLGLSDGRQMVFNDPRKFGRVWLTLQPEDVTGRLGPEPLDPDFTLEMLSERLQARSRLLKPLLLDQAFLAGMGNIYTDEALHLSGLHPLRRSDTLTAAETQRLFAAIRAVLQDGISHNGASIDWVYRGGSFQNNFRVYARTGLPCPTCQTPILKLSVGQRGTHICPACQPAP